jgi:hypothetical protein
MELAPRCTTHRDRLAGWTCGACGALLCAQSCSAWRTVGQGTMEVCLLCGGPAQAVRVRRALLTPFGVRAIVESIRWPFHREGLLTAFACAFVLWLLGMAGMLAGLFGMGIVLAVCFHVTRSTARGEDEFRDAGDFRGFFEDVIGPVFRALFASLWLYGPIAIYSFRHGALPPFGLGVLMLAAGAFFFPMALLAGAIDAPLHYLINPLVIIGYPLRLGRDYALLAGFALLVSLCDSLLLSAARGIDANLTHLPDVLVYGILLLPPLMLFRAMGLLVRVRGDELGYGGESAYLVPVLGSLRPAREQCPSAQ